MRKILLFNLFLLLFFSARAQFSYEATGDHGKLWEITQDPSAPERLYAVSLINHIMVSYDRGKTWEIFYSFENSRTRISSFKLLPGNKSFSFVATSSPDMSMNGLYVVDLETKATIRHYITPDQYLDAWVASYDIYDPEGKIVVLNTQYMEGFSLVITEVYFTKDGGENMSGIYYSRENQSVHVNNSFFHPDDPKKIYLARSLGSEGVNGGLLISSDEGNTWREELAGKGTFSAVAFNPKDHKEFFIGSFINFGAGPEALFHTLDSGKTFEQVPVTFTDQTLDNITQIVYDPGNNKNLWMTDENEILKSTDGGAHWTSTVFQSRSPVYYYGTSMAINPKNSNDLLISSDAWPQHTTDGGKTFTQLKLPFCVASSMALGNGSNPQLYYSVLGGYISKNLTTGKSAAYNIQPYDVVNVREMQVIPDTTVPGRIFLFRASDGFSNPAELFYSDDQGATLKQLPSDQFATGLGFIQRDPNNKDRYWISYSYYSSFSTLFRVDFSDAANPEAIPVSLPYDGLLTAAFVPHGNGGQTLYLSAGTKVYLSQDGGVTWGEKIQGLELTEGYDMVWDLKANPFDEKTMAVATTQGIFQTTDGGDQWTLSLPASDLKRVTYSNAVNGHIFAVSLSTNYTDTRLAFSTNKGAKWSNVSADMLAYISCSSSIEFKCYENSADIYFATPDLGVVKYKLNNLLSPQLLFLTSFTGSLQRGNAFLEWRTRNEEGLSRYELERSTNNKDFSLINTQQATNSNGSFYYKYEDQEFPALAAQFGNVYYRLKLVSEDNSFAYSDTVKLTARDMYIYPVPATNVINLHVQGVTQAAKYRILLVDVSGRQYSIQQYDVPTGQTTITMPVTRLASGMYIMLVETRPGDIRKFKFIKL
ncbi:T9SS type A sorting domain-containing protein [Chitinophaga filiformis]|uniref:Por secretion system C-terminal sorting domain-containing protein n=1 Tax=Chitinophaga filiformis TaxID=104663 RepID=A0A1G7VHH5_CHIFI|nr:T9SS type A sorting domain-containing protein [Chitinophaga filiformis]SDG59275.1 Por secretion system C-terminal sorting domain-containing protein [Chitinophaga filiformis]